MSFLETVRRVRSHLEEQDRVSLRALKREFELDDDVLDELVEELVDVQQVAVREGQILAWVGPGRSEPPIRELSRVERDPRDYTPKHLADKILQSKSALEGERKQVTVLFADVKSSMELAEQAGPEQWHEILDRFLRILAAGVHRFEGTVNQYTGDGIMALFGAPIAHEDHAQRACYAALHLTESVGELAQQLRREHGLDFQMRVGLNSGEVVVGKIGDDLRMDYTAQGETVGLAQRMETLAETGRPYLTQATAALAEGWFDLADLGEFKVKGAPVPVPVFALDGVGSFRTRLDLSRARGFSRFVGRADDLATLEAALEQALEGQGQVVGIVADAGVGKSRLCLEFTDRCRARGITVHEAQAVSHGRNIPLLPVLQLLRDIFGIDARDSDAQARQKIAGAVVLRDESLQRDLPLLFDFMGVPDPKRPASPLEPDERQRRLGGLWRQLLQAQSREEAGVYLVEDLHWIDEASENFVEGMVEAIPGTRNLVLVNFRPEYKVPWGGKSYYRQIPLLPLGSDAMRELLAGLLGSDPSLGDLAERTQERAAGNPFFIEEMVQSLVDAGSLEGERGAYRLVTPVHEIALPERVETLLAARIDRIDEREKRVLQTASVIGGEFSRAVLAKVSELDADDLDEALRRLTAAEFVHERQIYPELEYVFKHPLTQEVAYHSLLGERRRATHAAVARAIEEFESEHLDEAASLLAHHYEEAGDTLAAARWHARAAGSWSTSAFRESLRHWQRVRELGGELPDSTEALGLRLLSIGGCLYLANQVRATDVEEIAALIREGRDLATRLADPRAKANFRLGAMFAVASSVELTDAIPLALEAVADADATGDVIFRLDVRGRISPFLASASPRLALEAAEVSELLLEEARSAGIEVPGPVALLLQENRGLALIQVGRLDEAGRVLERARQQAAQAGDEFLLCGANCFLAMNEYYRGNAARATDYGRQAVDAAERLGRRTSIVLAYMQYGSGLLVDGPFDEAERVLRRTLDLADEAGMRLLRPGIQGWLADALMELGRAEEALPLANQAIENGQVIAMTAMAHVSRARALRLRDGLASTPEVEACLAAVAVLVEKHGLRSVARAVHEERARFAKLRGDDDGFRAELGRARDLAAELGATGHLERLERELASA